MRKRLMSILLCLVMLFSLVPGAAVPVHAFWDDYDDGFDCPNCDHYHFGSDYMCDCLFCTIDCNYKCWVETHCNDCGVLWRHALLVRGVLQVRGVHGGKALLHLRQVLHRRG